MQHEGIPPDNFTLDHLLYALAWSDEGFEDIAIQIYQIMEKKFGVIPSEKHKLSIIHTFVKKGNLAEAVKMLQLDLSITPTVDVVRLLVGLYRKGLCPERIVEIWDQVKDQNITLDETTLSSMIAACTDAYIITSSNPSTLSADLLPKLRLTLGEMAEKWTNDEIIGQQQMTTLCLQFLRGFETFLLDTAPNQNQTFFEILKKIENYFKTNCLPDIKVSTVLIMMYSRCGNLEEVLGVWKEIENSGLKKDIQVYNVMISALGHQKKVYCRRPLFLSISWRF